MVWFKPRHFESTHMKTLEQYLRDEMAHGHIDHRLRVNVVNGVVSFYIHPSGGDGFTADFTVEGNSLQPVPSSGPVATPIYPPHLG